MEYRAARSEELPELTRLENRVFGDNEEFCRLAFLQFAGGADNIFTAWQDGSPAGMLLVVPVTMEGRCGGYLFAVATAPECRGQGVMSGLMEWTKTECARRGLQFLCLIPADDGLFDFYRRFGFRAEFCLHRYSCNIGRNLLAQASFDEVNLKLLPQLRQKYFRGSLVQPEQGALAAVLTDYYSGGGSSVHTDHAYGLFRKKGDRLCFDELACDSLGAFEELLEACRQHNGARTAAAVLSDETQGIVGGSTGRPNGMLCFLGPEFRVRDGYLNLLINENDFEETPRGGRE